MRKYPFDVWLSTFALPDTPFKPTLGNDLMIQEQAFAYVIWCM